MSSNEKSLGIEDVLELFDDFLSAEDVLTTKLMTQVATSVTEQRLALNMTQAQFAEHINVKQSQVSRWEHGGNNFTLRKLAEIACALDMDIDITLRPVSDSQASGNPAVLKSANFLIVCPRSASLWGNNNSSKKEEMSYDAVC